MSESGNRWTFRALAVVIAVGIWLPASFCPRLREMTTPPVEETVQAGLNFPDHEHMMVVGRPEEVFEVLIRGSEDQIASVSRDQIRILVPLGENMFGGASYSGPRELEVILAVEDVVLPDDADGIDVVSVTPDRLTVTVDEEISEQVPVQVDSFIGEPIGGVGVDYGGVRIEPRVVTVQGSRSEINRQGYAVAGPIDIEGRGVDFVADQVRVRFESEYVQVEFPTFVTVEVPMVSDLQPPSSGGGS